MHDAAGQEDAIISALRRIVRANDLHSRLLLHRYGLTTPQLAALREIARHDGVAAGPLAQALHIGQATLTGILQRLEQRGLVSRQRAERDRRSVTLRITAEGSAVLAGAPSPLDDRFRAELAELQDWERTQILASLQRVAAMMHAAPHSGTGLPRGGGTDRVGGHSRESAPRIARECGVESQTIGSHEAGPVAERAAPLLATTDHAVSPGPLLPADSSVDLLSSPDEARTTDGRVAHDDPADRASPGSAISQHDS